MRRLNFLLLVWTFVRKISCQDLPMVLEPIREDGDEVALLIVPGAYINAIYYRPLAEALQNSTNLRLWVGLVGPFATDLPNPVQCSKDIEDTLTLMNAMGMQTDVLFLAGHSLGGVVMQSWGWENQDQLTGLILMASELTLDSLAFATLPVMHISGDLDGMETVSKMAPVYQELQTLVAVDSENKINFPVVIIENVDHMHFASGPPPAAVLVSDILSPMNEDTAHNLIAFFMLAFMTSMSGVPAESVANASLTLQYAYDNTGFIMKPLFDMEVFTDSGAYSEWSQEAQIIVSSIQEGYEDLLNVTDTILPMNELEISRPSIELIGEKAYIDTYTNVKYPSTLQVNGPQSAEQMSVKFKSREAVMEVLSVAGVPFNGNTSCQLVNQAGLDKTLSSATPLQVSRYFSRGKLIIFEEDDEKTTGSAWVNNDITYISNDTNLIVTSTSLHTDTSVTIENLAGMQYCKLMPPSRMIEYIMIDSLRGTTP